MGDVPLRPDAEAVLDRSGDRGAGRRSWSRSAVHLGLLCSAAAALGTLQLLHVRLAIHADVGLAFVGLVLVHLGQRRRTLARMAQRLVRAMPSFERAVRLTVADAALFAATLDVLVSGVVDWSRGAPVEVPLPRPFQRWHLDAGLLLVVCLAVHVWRRRKRLRRSTIR